MHMHVYGAKEVFTTRFARGTEPQRMPCNHANVAVFSSAEYRS